MAGFRYSELKIPSKELLTTVCRASWDDKPVSSSIQILDQAVDERSWLFCRTGRQA